jgi:hypothetical protein
MWQRETKKRATKTTQRDNRVYTLEVFILTGPLPESFIKKNKVVSRTIKILGGRTPGEPHSHTFNIGNVPDVGAIMLTTLLQESIRRVFSMS